MTSISSLMNQKVGKFSRSIKCISPKFKSHYKKLGLIIRKIIICIRSLSSLFLLFFCRVSFLEEFETPCVRRRSRQIYRAFSFRSYVSVLATEADRSRPTNDRCSRARDYRFLLTLPGDKYVEPRARAYCFIANCAHARGST